MKINKRIIKATIVVIGFYIIYLFMVLSKVEKTYISVLNNPQREKAEYCFDYDVEGEMTDYRVIGGDPLVVYAIKEGNYDRGMIRFSEKADNEICYRIYYAIDTESFSENDRAFCYQKEGTNYTIFELPADHTINYIRVDYEGIKNDVIGVGDTFGIKSVYVVKDSVFSYLSEIFTAKTILTVLIVVVMYVLVITNKDKGDTVEKKS